MKHTGDFQDVETTLRTMYNFQRGRLGACRMQIIAGFANYSGLAPMAKRQALDVHSFPRRTPCLQQARAPPLAKRSTNVGSATWFRPTDRRSVFSATVTGSLAGSISCFASSAAGCLLSSRSVGARVSGNTTKGARHRGLTIGSEWRARFFGTKEKRGVRRTQRQ